MSNDLEFSQGDSVQIGCSVTKASDSGIFDLTSATATLSIRESKNGAALVTETVTGIPSPTLGVVQFELGSSQTSIISGELFYDVKVVKASKTYTVVKAREYEPNLKVS